MSIKTHRSDAHHTLKQTYRAAYTRFRDKMCVALVCQRCFSDRIQWHEFSGLGIVNFGCTVHYNPSAQHWFACTLQTHYRTKDRKRWVDSTYWLICWVHNQLQFLSRYDFSRKMLLHLCDPENFGEIPIVVFFRSTANLNIMLDWGHVNYVTRDKWVSGGGWSRAGVTMGRVKCDISQNRRFSTLIFARSAKNLALFGLLQVKARLKFPLWGPKSTDHSQFHPTPPISTPISSTIPTSISTPKSTPMITAKKVAWQW
jgi:hypothetical protein